MAETQQPRGLTGTPPREPERAAERRVLALLSEAAARQREAIMARDVRALNRLFDGFLQLHSELGVLIAERKVSGAAETEIAMLARQVREQLGLNRVLLANGIAMTDHYMACLSAASTADGRRQTGDGSSTGPDGPSTSPDYRLPTTVSRLPSPAPAVIFTGVA